MNRIHEKKKKKYLSCLVSHRKKDKITIMSVDTSNTGGKKEA